MNSISICSAQRNDLFPLTFERNCDGKYCIVRRSGTLHVVKSTQVFMYSMRRSDHSIRISYVVLVHGLTYGQINIFPSYIR